MILAQVVAKPNVSLLLILGLGIVIPLVISQRARRVLPVVAGAACLFLAFMLSAKPAFVLDNSEFIVPQQFHGVRGAGSTFAAVISMGLVFAVVWVVSWAFDRKPRNPTTD